MRTPINTLRWILRELDDQEKSQHNLSAITTARLTNILLHIAHGFSGAKGPPPQSEPKDFLPFPDWKPASTEDEGPDEPTKFVLSQLIQARRLPIHVFTALISPAEQAT